MLIDTPGIQVRAGMAVPQGAEVVDYQGSRAATVIIRRRAVYHLGRRGLGARTSAIQVQLRRPRRAKRTRSCSTGTCECWCYGLEPHRRRSTTDPARPVAVRPDAYAGVNVNKQASRPIGLTAPIVVLNPLPHPLIFYVLPCRPPGVFVVDVSLRVWRENSILTALVARRLILSEIV